MGICEACGGEMLTVTGCTQASYWINGKEHKRVPADPNGKECHDCGALKGEYHHPHCDMERCPVCGQQLLSCEHASEAYASVEGDDE